MQDEFGNSVNSAGNIRDASCLLGSQPFDAQRSGYNFIQHADEQRCVRRRLEQGVSNVAPGMGCVLDFFDIFFDKFCTVSTHTFQVENFF